MSRLLWDNVILSASSKFADPEDSDKTVNIIAQAYDAGGNQSLETIKNYTVALYSNNNIEKLGRNPS